MKKLIFIIGTEAELIKLFPVIMSCQSKGAECSIIATGQNDIKNSRVLEILTINAQFIELSKEEDIVKTYKGLFKWFVNTVLVSNKIVKNNMQFENKNKPLIIVHGDTISTVMGAMIGKRLKCKVAHIEAGLRSFNYLNPFPEEIDRIIVSKIARVHFAPGEDATYNLEKAKGEIVNTAYNTILDSLLYSDSMPLKTDAVKDILNDKYFVFVMHRQENIRNRDFAVKAFKNILKQANNMKCVIILHAITEIALQNYGFYDQFTNHKNIVMMPRVDYFDFMKLLKNSQYVITDGGSNQEELSYMGKPCLILRKKTERFNGIGMNAVMYDGKASSIDRFCKYYKSYIKEPLVDMVSPSKIIADYILK